MKLYRSAPGNNKSILFSCMNVEITWMVVRHDNLRETLKCKNELSINSTDECNSGNSGAFILILTRNKTESATVSPN